GAAGRTERRQAEERADDAHQRARGGHPLDRVDRELERRV
ncbi:MAG: hypothetical protein AVDCRST_MAG30-4160, partial [uncultured Solirubrobacteraceae bacterium]